MACQLHCCRGYSSRFVVYKAGLVVTALMLCFAPANASHGVQYMQRFMHISVAKAYSVQTDLNLAWLLPFRVQAISTHVPMVMPGPSELPPLGLVQPEGKAKAEQANAVYGLITRLLPDHVNAFTLRLGLNCREGHKACFEVSVTAGKVAIGATSGARRPCSDLRMF